jgi:hypothetical protein
MARLLRERFRELPRGDIEPPRLLAGWRGQNNRWQMMLREARAKLEYDLLTSPEHKRNLKEQAEIEYLRLLKEKTQARNELLNLLPRTQTDNLYRYSHDKFLEDMLSFTKDAISRGLNPEEVSEQVHRVFPYLKLQAFTPVN